MSDRTPREFLIHAGRSALIVPVCVLEPLNKLRIECHEKRIEPFSQRWMRKDAFF
jgi:hypothetical protein